MLYYSMGIKLLGKVILIIPTVIYELNIPSGRMIVSDNIKGFPLRGVVIGEYPEESIETSLELAKVGLAYGYVGNSNPCIFKADDKKFIIAKEG